VPKTVLVLLISAFSCWSQTTDASLSGTITDPAGAAAAAASVSARNISTGVIARTSANDSGVYIFAALHPGKYRLEVEQTGFRKAAFNDLLLEVGAKLTVNVELELGALAETVEVSAAGATVVGYATSSVGGIITSEKVMELPLESRNALQLIATQPGTVGDNFSGNRSGSLNITIDGTNMQDNLLNGIQYTPIVASVDRVEEFRIVTSPADAELGRGSGQVQILTRSGTNQFHGSLFEFHRNTLLTANTWFNNQRGIDPQTGQPVSPRNNLIRNQYGGRIGGPVLKNKTFFHFTYEGQRVRTRNAVTCTVLTEPARRGLFRFFPGVQNGNAFARVPTVDLQGNPVRPPGAGELQTVSVFSRDPFRMVADRTGAMARQLALMPLPNQFWAGDGLNTAGFTWGRSSSEDFDQIALRADHHFNSSHRLSFSYSFEDQFGINVSGAQQFPDVPPGGGSARDNFYSASLTSVFRSNLLGEFRAGVLRPTVRILAPWEIGGIDVLPHAAAEPYLLSLAGITSPMFPGITASPSNRISPVYQTGQNMTWLRGRHTFKGGVEARFVSSAGFDANFIMARASVGAGAVPVQNIGNIPSIGLNQGAAQNLLNNLAGSLNGAQQGFNSPGGRDPFFLPGENKHRNWRTPEFSWFFKDDFKVNPNLTLNLGLRYEWYGVPSEGRGKALALEGGSAGIFGITGSSFADMFQPGRQAGTMTRVVPIGPGTVNPNRQFYANDNNNFAPAVGLSWSLPWLGRNKTTLRTGYGIGYERNPIYLVHTIGAAQPGYFGLSNFVTASYLDTGSLRLPLPTLGKPLELVPFTDRAQTLYSYDDNLRTAYIQNWNLSIQRNLGNDFVLDVRYVGSKGTKLVREASINEVNIFETGILDAFLITQAGGQAPLLDRIFMGLNISGLGVVDGSRITGSDAVRFRSDTQGMLANNNVGSFAAFLNNNVLGTNQQGGLLRRAGLPENFIVPNPQFGAANLAGNFANSTYHSLQIELVRRFQGGWLFQGSYNWSRNLGEEDGDGIDLLANYRTQRNRRLDKKLLSYHRTHAFKNNGIYELPFGPGRRFGNSSRGWKARLIERWQVAGIFNLFSGSPLGLTTGVASFNAFGGNTPVPVAALPKSTGKVMRTPNGVVYFDGLNQVADPHIPRLTTLQAIQGRSTLRAITDSSGNLLLVNPAPGEIGALAPRFLEGPGSFRLDLNLIKRIRLTEFKNIELRLDAVNATNSPQFSNPNGDINSLNFGRITGAGGNRVVVIGSRLNF